MQPREIRLGRLYRLSLRVRAQLGCDLGKYIAPRRSRRGSRRPLSTIYFGLFIPLEFREYFIEDPYSEPNNMGCYETFDDL
eukprot:gene8937-biopygen14917